MSRVETCLECGKPLIEEGDPESESPFCDECAEAIYGLDKDAY